MTKKELYEKLVQTIHMIQEMSGEENVAVDKTTIPIGSLPGFDSLRAVETITGLSGFIGHEIGGDVNLFVSDKQNPLSLDEITDKIHSLINK